MYRPKRVRLSTIAAIDRYSVGNDHRRRDPHPLTGDVERNELAQSNFSLYRRRHVWDRRAARTKAVPDPSAIPSMPSVTMNAGTCSLVISSPLTMPHKSPVATPAASPTGMPTCCVGKLEFGDVLRRP